MIRKILCGILLLSGISAFGQSGYLYPDYFSGFFNTLSLINPSYVQPDARAEASVNYKFRRGIFSDVRTFAASGEKIWRNEKNARLIRLQFLNEREGEYISRPRFYGNYAYQLALSSRTFLSGGLSLGFTQVNFSAPSGPGNATLPDGAVGIGIKIQNFEAGISSQHLFNSSGKINGGTIHLPRFFNIHTSGKINLSSAFDAKGYILYREMPYITDHLNIAVSLLYLSKIETGIMYKTKRGISYFGSINLSEQIYPLYISIVYNSRFLSETPMWGDSFEIGMGLKIR